MVPPDVTPMLIRERLLDAAARVFAEAGFRGATTRRIAEVAKVNEVTLFRHFGSKAQLLADAMSCVHPSCSHELPSVPGDVEQELVDWSEAHLGSMRTMASVIRRTMAELDEHPEMRAVISEAKTPYIKQLVAYATRVRRPTSQRERDDLRTACSMLSSALFADAIGREVVPAAYPDPEGLAARKYVRAFLRLLHAAGVPARAPRRRPAATP